MNADTPWRFRVAEAHRVRVKKVGDAWVVDHFWGTDYGFAGWEAALRWANRIARPRGHFQW